MPVQVDASMTRVIGQSYAMFAGARRRKDDGYTRAFGRCSRNVIHSFW
ncbi:hypothetical protein [Paraburkholderia oxyphila]|nr:hypothetical protein [Paraburkholderia oxyphila]